MNEYIFTPNLDLDLDRIKEIALTKPLGGFVECKVSDDPYLEEIRAKYPVLSEHYYLYHPNWETPPHNYLKWKSALCIPINPTEYSDVLFFKIKEDSGILYGSPNHSEVYGMFNPLHVEETNEVAITGPMLINTVNPFNFVTGPNTDNLILSWGITSSFLIAKTVLGN